MREQAKLSRRKADRWTEDVYNNTGVGSAIDERSWAKRFAFKRDGLAAANTRYASQTVASRRNPQLQRRTRWFSMDDFCIQTGCCGPSQRVKSEIFTLVEYFIAIVLKTQYLFRIQDSYLSLHHDGTT